MSAGIGRLQAAVDLLIEVDVLLVVVEAQARQQAQAIGYRHSSWPKTAALVFRNCDELVVAVAVEQTRRRRRRARRQQEARRRRALFLLEGRIGVDRLMEREAAGDAVDARGDGAGVTDLLRPLAGVSRAPPRSVVTGRPMKSRSFDGFQFQKRHAGRRRQRPRPTFQSRLSDEPPRSWYDCSGVSVSVTRSKALKLGGV